MNSSFPLVQWMASGLIDQEMRYQPFILSCAVDGIWFGGGPGLASNFQVVGNCSVLQLTANGGHGTTIYTGPVPLAPNG